MNAQGVKPDVCLFILSLMWHILYVRVHYYTASDVVGSQRASRVAVWLSCVSCREDNEKPRDRQAVAGLLSCCSALISGADRVP